MKVSRLKIVYAALNVALFISVLFIGITTSQPTYDPWLDVNDDGYGGIDDIVSTAEHFGASGDPAKLCNITNWPTSSAITVWYLEPFEDSLQPLISPIYNANGFSELHLLIYVENLTGSEVVTVMVCSVIFNPANSSDYRGMKVQSFDVTSDMVVAPPNAAGRGETLPVPSEIINFAVISNNPATVCEISVSFYLTWA